MTPEPVLTTEEIRHVEERASRSGGRSLMQRAGRAAAQAAQRIATDTGSPILVVAGPGNNGGDAWVAAAYLSESFHKVVVLDVAGTTPKATEAKTARTGLQGREGTVVDEWPEALRPALIVDGLLGLGLARDVDLHFAEIIARINASGVPVLAIDSPSGLDSRSGAVRGSAVRATHTITFIAHKVGLHTGDGVDHCGQVTVDDLGTREEVERIAKGALLTPETVSPWLPSRARNSHKGRFGSLGIIGGNRGMVGAALLAARAALLCGTGKVRAGLLAPDAPPVDIERPEIMLGSVDDALGMDVIVAGPGAGQSPSATSVSMFERTLIPNLTALAKPVVFDADALNAIAFNASLETALVARRSGPTILTPHPAEAARLLHKGTPEVNEDRLGSALALAQRFNAYVVLKGAGSICALPDGRWSINTTGNAGLASAGSGDVLAGMIGAFLAQKLEPDKALQYAVCLHGAAAEACAQRGIGPVGLTAMDVALEARTLLNRWTASPS
jgi:hydroxyethylthiazole kinase-like uncharacterized protein yjeF